MRKLARGLRAVLNDVLYLGGAALISWGAWLIYPPAGYIAAGAGLVAYALLIT